MRHALALLPLLAACSADLDAATAVDESDWLPQDLGSSELIEGVDVEETIWYGTPATQSDWIPVVAIGTGGSAFCSAAVVKRDMLLTAAHCVTPTAPTQVFGGYDVTGAVPRPTGSVARVEYHPGWNPRTLENDIAVVYLSQPLPRSVKPFKRANQNHFLTFADEGQVATAVGYGLTEFGTDGRKNKVDVNMDSLDYPELILADASSGGVCFGDSGGPLFHNIGGVRRIVGVASFIQYGPTGCDGISGWTRVDAYDSWLDTKY